MNELEKRAKQHKKRQKGLPLTYLNTNAGNPEVNAAIFNKMNSSIEGPSNNPISGPFGGDVSAPTASGGEGGGMGESLNRNIDHDNVQWGVHRFSTNSIIFRGTEQECQKFIDEHDWLWDDAEVYFMTPDDPHYINESNDKKIPEMIDLEYENITVTVYGDKRDVDDWDEWEVLTDWTYKVSRDDIEVYIIESLLNETDIPNIADISDEEVDKFVTENFDSLFAKYEDKIKDYYHDDAVEDAQERYEYEPDYPDYDPYDEYDLYEDLHPRIKKNSVLEEDRADDNFDLFLRGV